MSEIYTIEVTDIMGQRYLLKELAGQVLFIVNTASACGFTPQYSELEVLHQKYQAQGLAVLGFPCDQFGHQEPGTEAEIQQFCQLNYGLSFRMHQKVLVNGPSAHPLFDYLKTHAPGILGSEAIKWNFTKFLVDRSGELVERYASNQPPSALVGRIETLLALHAQLK